MARSKSLLDKDELAVITTVKEKILKDGKPKRLADNNKLGRVLTLMLSGRNREEIRRVLQINPNDTQTMWKYFEPFVANLGDYRRKKSESLDVLAQKVLLGINDEKIERARLLEVAKTFQILNLASSLDQGKPTHITLDYGTLLREYAATKEEYDTLRKELGIAPGVVIDATAD